MNNNNIKKIQSIYKKSNLAFILLAPLAILFIGYLMFSKYFGGAFETLKGIVVLLVIIIFIIVAISTTKLKNKLNREYVSYLTNTFEEVKSTNVACVRTIQSNNKYIGLYKILCTARDDNELRQLAQYYNTEESYANFFEDLSLYGGNKKNDNFAKMLIDYRVNNMNIQFNKPKKDRNFINTILIISVIVITVFIIIFGISNISVEAEAAIRLDELKSNFSQSETYNLTTSFNNVKLEIEKKGDKDYTINLSENIKYTNKGNKEEVCIDKECESIDFIKDSEEIDNQVRKIFNITDIYEENYTSERHKKNKQDYVSSVDAIDDNGIKIGEEILSLNKEDNKLSYNYDTTEEGKDYNINISLEF